MQSCMLRVKPFEAALEFTRLGMRLLQRRISYPYSSASGTSARPAALGVDPQLKVGTWRLHPEEKRPADPLAISRGMLALKSPALGQGGYRVTREGRGRCSTDAASRILEGWTATQRLD